jgi:hypothetical protein
VVAELATCGPIAASGIGALQSGARSVCATSAFSGGIDTTRIIPAARTAKSDLSYRAFV